jgi:hypothetical protein
MVSTKLPPMAHKAYKQLNLVAAGILSDYFLFAVRGMLR